MIMLAKEVFPDLLNCQAIFFNTNRIFLQIRLEAPETSSSELQSPNANYETDQYTSLKKPIGSKAFEIWVPPSVHDWMESTVRIVEFPR